MYVCMCPEEPLFTDGIFFWPVEVRTGACCEPLVAKGQQVKRSVTTNTSQRSFFTSAPKELYPWHRQTWVLFFVVRLHCLFVYTSRFMLCQFCCQQWQKGARIHSNDMARRGIWECSRDEERTQSQLQNGFCCCHCCRSNGRHPSLSAVSPREVQRACDEDEAILLILSVRQSAPQFALEGGKRKGTTGKCRWVNAARVYGLEIYLAANWK